MIRVIIVDDQEIVREGLKMILSLHDEIEVIG
jgi:DNA-binding NarL/FixJ family response regulator